ncbi:MAG: formimidoylglutamase [Parvularcula sp.]
MAAFHRPAELWTGRADPEDGDAARRVYHFFSETAERAVLGFACDIGVIRNKGRPGAAEAPCVIRRSLSGLAAPADMEPFADLGDIVAEGEDLEAAQERLGRAVTEALTNHKRVVVLGGGHETAYGSYLGLARHFPNQRIGIINLDAHLDLRAVGDAGASSGTPFTQIHDLTPDRFDYLCLGVAEEANTQALFRKAREWGVGIVHDTEFLANPACADASIDEIISRNDIIYLTIDIDVLPLYQAPGVSAPAVRGVPFAVVERLVKSIMTKTAAQKKIMPLTDIVEVAPRLDPSGATVRSAAYLARQLLAG